MRRRAPGLLALAAILVAATAVIPAAEASAPSRAARMPSLETRLLSEVNTLRLSHGLAPLRISVSLSLAAHGHSLEMAARGYFGHNSFNGSRFDRRIVRFYPVGRRRYWSVGENLLWSSPDVDARTALERWLDSPEHRANLLTPRWREIGLSAVHAASAPGTFAGREVTIVTADFGVRH